MPSSTRFSLPIARLPRRPDLGFSLVELLVVAGILTIAMAAVMGTLSLALQTSRNNSSLVEANNNVRAALNFIKNDLDNVGELPLTSVFSTGTANPKLGAPAVYVRSGFLQARGFPVGVGSTAPNRIGGVVPLLESGTISTTCDIISPIQAWTRVAGGATAVGSFTAPNIVANQGYAAVDGTSAATRYPNLRVYPGACDRTEVATAYGNGSHQLITLQVNPVPVALRVRVPDPANPGGEIIQRQIFPVEATFSARAQVSGSSLVLQPEIYPGPETYGGTIPPGTPINLNPRRVAPNVVLNANPFVNPADILLGRRLRPYVDTLLLTYQYTPPGSPPPPPTLLSVLGLVTGIDGNNIVLQGNDLAGINPANWGDIIQNNVPVTITRMRLSHYFVGWNGGDAPPILFYREGGLLAPLAFDVENFRMSFDLVDEGAVTAAGVPIQGIMFNTDQTTPAPPATSLGVPVSFPPGAGPSPDPNPPRSPLTTKTQVRMVRLTVYGRTNERERALINADAPIPDAFNRGYFHVSERTTVGLRNLAPQ
ncbi:prepilin-type N-terminal cleavage/methylation domain-containing protein [Chloracidobacterium validum]|uniref:Prepilin-type N-terminal cleavage/methylation domain-containing protein n=1 Tax=Chloracidobacterium validum TaxID=2821543 RepID=A0ABX8B9M1_9BACT|nr:prepilin-type N-terminal cleavage/methylation domain-containing protein [Chloracidobacterium validum]QUW02255.1 prepilin-type N-terminal cleavage/methylation domain-containing protein [Chloracidobacterium validum]